MEGGRSCSDCTYVEPFTRQNETDQTRNVLVIFNDKADSPRQGPRVLIRSSLAVPATTVGPRFAREHLWSLHASCVLLSAGRDGRAAAPDPWLVWRTGRPGRQPASWTGPVGVRSLHPQPPARVSKALSRFTHGYPVLLGRESPSRG